MNPDPHPTWVRTEITRGSFFARGRNALGMAALGVAGSGSSRRRASRAATAGASAGRRAAALSAQGQARHLPAHGRRAVADGPVRLQAGDGGVVRQGPARLRPHGPAAHHDDLRPEAVPDRAVEVQVRAARAVRACGSASCCRRPGQDASTTCASSAACTPRRSTTSRPSATCRPATRSPAGRASARGSSYGLGSLNENLPTFVVLVAKPTNTEQVQAISARLWSSGYLPGEHAGVSFRTGGDPILYINNPPGVPAEVRRATLDGLQRAQRAELSARSAIRRRTRASSSTSWPSACRRACRS